jgi:hypothetical protein
MSLPSSGIKKKAKQETNVKRADGFSMQLFSVEMLTASVTMCAYPKSGLKI